MLCCECAVVYMQCGILAVGLPFDMANGWCDLLYTRGDNFETT